MASPLLAWPHHLHITVGGTVGGSCGRRLHGHGCAIEHADIDNAKGTPLAPCDASLFSSLIPHARRPRASQPSIPHSGRRVPFVGRFGGTFTWLWPRRALHAWADSIGSSIMGNASGSSSGVSGGGISSSGSGGRFQLGLALGAWLDTLAALGGAAPATAALATAAHHHGRHSRHRPRHSCHRHGRHRRPRHRRPRHRRPRLRCPRLRCPHYRRRRHRRARHRLPRHCRPPLASSALLPP